MTCALADAQLYLPAYDIRVRPFSVTFERDIGRLDHAQLEISRAAGELIGEQLFYVTRAYLSFDGKVLARLALEAEDVTLTREKAIVRLRDPKVALNYGTVDGVYERTTLSDVVGEIMDARDDPHRVLTSYKFTNADETRVSETLRSRYRNVISGVNGLRRRFQPGIAARDYVSEHTDNGVIRWFENFEADVIVAASRGIEALHGVDVERGGFEFSGATPIEALQQVEQEFGVQSWVDDEGVLWIGLPQARGTPFVASHYPGALKIREWDVVENASPVTGVVGYGTYKGNDILTGEVEIAGSEDVQLRVEATWTGESAGRVVQLSPMRIEDPVELANAVERTLRRYIYDNASGEFTINPLASSDAFGSVFEIRLGDQIFVVGAESGCGKSIPTDIFAVHGIRHKITPDGGWELSVRVGKLIDSDAVQVRPFIVNPKTGDWVDANEYYSSIFDRDIDVLDSSTELTDEDIKGLLN